MPTDLHATLDGNDQRSIAQRMFDGAEAESELEVQLYEAGLKDFDRLGWDWYDCSLEIYGVPADFRLPEDMQRICHAAGFAKVYVNHVDKWETHYDWKHDAPFTVSKGWRVSYPHKRNDGSKDIWVEAHIPGWPQEWFASGYVKVKEWLKSLQP